MKEEKEAEHLRNHLAFRDMIENYRREVLNKLIQHEEERQTQIDSQNSDKNSEENFTDEQSKSLSIYYTENSSISNKSDTQSDKGNEDKDSVKSENNIINQLDELE